MFKRKFFALLMITCLCASLFAVPSAMALPELSIAVAQTADTITATGVGVPGEEVQLLINGIENGKRIADAGTGAYSITFGPVSSGGTFTVAVEYTNGSIGSGASGGSVTLTGPVATTVDLNIAVTSDNIETITAIGVGKPNTGVKLLINNGEVQTKNTDSAGNYSFTWKATTGGTYSVGVAYTTSGNGNGANWGSNVTLSGPASEGVALTLDVTTNGINTITATGKGKANSEVQLLINGIVNGSKTTTASGDYSITWTTTAGGTYPVGVAYAVPTNGAAKNWGSNVTLTGPVGLSNIAVSLEGRNGLRVVGKGCPNGRIKIDVSGGDAISVDIGSDGRFDEIIMLSAGTYSSVLVGYTTSKDTYGTPTSVTVPINVTVSPATTDDITITSVTPGIKTISVEGKAKAGTTVKATVGTASGTEVVSSNGTFKINITLAAGTYTGATVVYMTSPAPGSGASTSAKYTVTDGASTPTPGPVTPTPAGGTYPTLARGMTGVYVTALQEHLKWLGYYTIKVDGIFGVGTQTAVRNFEIMNNLPADGIADDTMQKLLYSGNAVGIINPSPTNPPSGYTTLSYGSRGTAVRNMQVRLANLGYYYGSVDGIFGSQTQSAVRNFQNRNNLVVNGIADSASQSAMYSSSAIPNSNSSSGYVYLHYGSRGSAVNRLQTALKNLGYYKGSIDGQYYDQTYAAVKSFQRANGLVVDGIAGKKTQNKLYGTNY